MAKKVTMKEKALRNMDKVYNQGNDVIVFLKNGKMVGKMVTRWTFPREGCIAHVSLMLSPLDYEHDSSMTYAEAGGYGYDKNESARSWCIREAAEWLRDAWGVVLTEEDLKAWECNFRKRFEEAGFTVLEVL